jgi:hypothetical protein
LSAFSLEKQQKMTNGVSATKTTMLQQ